MASKPMVTLTLAGDEAKLTDAMSKVGGAAKDMADKVGGASKDMVSSGKSVDDLADKAGTSEQRFIGFKDSITGVQDVMAGFKEGSILGMAQGFADLAGGMESFLIPMIGNLGTALKVGLGSAMSFIAAHPLLIALGLLAAAFVLLWTNSETFRRIVMNVFHAVGDFVVGVVDWIVDRWNGLVSWFGSLPRRIGEALGALGGFIGDAFKGALNLAIDFLNWGIDRINWLIGGVNDINPFGDIPGIPHIPRLHAGIERVPGAPGTEMLAVLQAGEKVSSAGSNAGGGQLALVISGDANGFVAEMVAGLFRSNAIQLVADGVPVEVVG